MFEFFEPEDEYKVDKGRHTNVQTRIALLTTLIVFGSILVLAVNLNFINVFKGDMIKEVCVSGNTYNRVEDNVLWLESAKKALKDHIENIQDLDGFLEANIKLKEINSEKKVPVINFVFEKKSTDKERIPKTICGFDVTINSIN